MTAAEVGYGILFLWPMMERGCQGQNADGAKKMFHAVIGWRGISERGLNFPVCVSVYLEAK